MPIPVKTNDDERAGKAMDAIECRLGLVVFDRESIENTCDELITRGLIFSWGTAVAPKEVEPENNCGNVSRAPCATDYPQSFVNSEGEISTVLYVNLDSKHCTASPEVVIHELGHAMGLGQHFQGFSGDDGRAISPDFWSVLATLYGNQIGTSRADLTVERPEIP